MKPGQFQKYVEERVTILTDGERIEGHMFRTGGIRLSDFLNSSVQQDCRYVKIKNPTVYDRRSGQELIAVPFVMVARERIVMVMTHIEIDAGETEPDDPFADRSGRESSHRLR